MGKESAYNVGDEGSVPGWGRSPGGGHSNPLQYSCLENPMDRGAWWATVHGVTEKSDTTEAAEQKHTSSRQTSSRTYFHMSLCSKHAQRESYFECSLGKQQTHL